MYIRIEYFQYSELPNRIKHLPLGTGSMYSPNFFNGKGVSTKLGGKQCREGTIEQSGGNKRRFQPILRDTSI